MNFDLFNNLLTNGKENNSVQNFIKELSNHLEKENNNINTNSLKQEDCIYQVIEMETEGVYLQNTNNNQVSKETDISKEVLDKIGNDSVLRYKNGEYVIEEELTQEFFDNLIEIKEYKQIQENFIKESGILENDCNTRYKIETKNKDYCILSYGNEAKSTIKVPSALIPFWAKIEENLYYKNGKFNRDI